MELFPKKYDLLLGKISLNVYGILLVSLGIYGSSLEYMVGKTKQGILHSYEGNQALFLIWGTVLILCTPLGLVFSSKKYALLWTLFCLLGGLALSALSFFVP